MDFQDSPSEATFRKKVRDWLSDNAPANELSIGWNPTEEDLIEAGRKWQATKAAAGFGAISAPQAIGGLDATAIETVIFNEEEARFNVRNITPINIGIHMALPVIYRHGTSDQLKRFLAPTIRGELLWCQLFSEPGAGSDLAALRTRAIRTDDGWIVNGQKVWSSWAHHADFGILIARTDPTVPKHKGLTFFVLDMRTPGIEIRPIEQISGKSDFNETFLTDVFIPDDCRIGDEGQGWACAMTVLTSERGSSGNANEAHSVAPLLDIACEPMQDGRRLIDRDDVCERLAHWIAEEQAVHFLKARMLTRLSKGKGAGAEGGISKLVFTNRLQRTAGYAMELLGYAGSVARSSDVHNRVFFDNYLWSAALRVAGGSDEVLRNQIAERILEMPGEIRNDKNTPFDQLGRSRQ